MVPPCQSLPEHLIKTADRLLPYSARMVILTQQAACYICCQMWFLLPLRPLLSRVIDNFLDALVVCVRVVSRSSRSRGSAVSCCRVQTCRCCSVNAWTACAAVPFRIVRKQVKCFEILSDQHVWHICGTICLNAIRGFVLSGSDALETMVGQTRWSKITLER